MNPARVYLYAGLAAAAAVALYVWRSGGFAKAGANVGAAAVEATGGVVAGAVGAIGAAVGLPTPWDTTTDPLVSRWMIDNIGHFEASKRSGAPAYVRALGLPAGSGRAPAGVQTDRGNGYGTQSPNADEFDAETRRLLNRYPAPAPVPKRYDPDEDQYPVPGWISP